MTDRKSPYEREVKPHIRAGVHVSKYKRGKGKKPTPPRPAKPSPGIDAQYNVTFFFSDGRETYNVGGGTLTGSLRAAIPLIQRPEVPQHAQIRRMQR